MLCGAAAAATTTSAPRACIRRRAFYPQNATQTQPQKQKNAAYNATCSTPGAVIGLQLQANNLDGSVEAVELGVLKATMEYLYLAGNNLRGDVRALLQGMARARRISMERNALTVRVACLLCLCLCRLLCPCCAARWCLSPLTQIKRKKNNNNDRAACPRSLS